VPEDTNATDVQHDSGSDAQSSMKLLLALAREQIVSDTNFLGKTRFNINRDTNTLFYDLGQVPPNVVLADGDPYAAPLEALLRAESLRRDFENTIPKDTFWAAPLDSVEQVVEECVRVLQVAPLNHDGASHQPECFQNVDQAFEKLRTSILKYAAAKGLQVTEPPGTKDIVVGYPVTIKIDPPKAHLKVMTLLEYKKYQYFKTPKEQYQWNDLLGSESDMIGWYHYRAEWPAELNGPEEGDFEVRKASTITFRPMQK
jgi:hypothetical protein